MTHLPQFPGSDRDWTVTLKKDVPIDQVFQVIDTIPSKLLKYQCLINIYTSENLGANKKNATFRFLYRNEHKTVEQPQVEKEHQRLISEITKKIRDFIC